MEFFVPGLLFFILTLIFTFYIAPKATPMIAAILSLVFLTYGVYDHYRMFASEYRSSTWQEPLLLMYSPAVMITVLILYVLYGMSALFTKGQVPVPAMPEMPSTPNIQNALNNVTESLSNAANSVANAANDMMNNVMNNSNRRNDNKNASNMSRSFVESV
jgi:predicted PurR-regulated permease PerM